MSALFLLASSTKANNKRHRILEEWLTSLSLWVWLVNVLRDFCLLLFVVTDLQPLDRRTSLFS
jgi:hypothetical protein